MSEIIDIIIASGWVGILLFGLLIGALYICVERAMTYRKSSHDLKKFAKEFAEKVKAARKHEKPDFAEALHYCYREGAEVNDDPSNLKGVVARVFSLAIRYRSRGPATLRTILNNHIDLEIVPDLRRYLRPLASIGKAAPLLGLLGTTLGMIRAFGNIYAEGSGVDPKDLAGDIGLALSTTFIGLIIAIFVVGASAYFRSKVERYEIDLDLYSDYCLDLLFADDVETIVPETLASK